MLIIHKNITTAWEKGIRFLKSTSSGKCVDDDGKTMYPNTNFLKFLRQKNCPKSREKFDGEDVREGISLILSKIISEYHLEKCWNNKQKKYFL